MDGKFEKISQNVHKLEIDDPMILPEFNPYIIKDYDLNKFTIEQKIILCYKYGFVDVEEFNLIKQTMYNYHSPNVEFEEIINATIKDIPENEFDLNQTYHYYKIDNLCLFTDNLNKTTIFYCDRELIGVGSYGKIYKLFNNGRRYALKIVKDPITSKTKEINIFLSNKKITPKVSLFCENGFLSKCYDQDLNSFITNRSYIDINIKVFEKKIINLLNRLLESHLCFDIKFANFVIDVENYDIRIIDVDDQYCKSKSYANTIKNIDKDLKFCIMMILSIMFYFTKNVPLFKNIFLKYPGYFIQSFDEIKSITPTFNSNNDMISKKTLAYYLNYYTTNKSILKNKGGREIYKLLFDT
jgi:hypothetical protein